MSRPTLKRLLEEEEIRLTTRLSFVKEMLALMAHTGEDPVLGARAVPAYNGHQDGAMEVRRVLPAAEMSASRPTTGGRSGATKVRGRAVGTVADRQQTQREAAARHVIGHGPCTMAELETVCEVSQNTMRMLLNHSWFEKEADGWHVTAAGYAALKDGAAQG